MNILFVTIFQNIPTNGGTERITCSVANELKQQYGHHVYSIYDIGENCNNDKSSPFQEEMKNIQGTNLSTYLNKWNIDVIIIQGAFDKVQEYRLALNGRKCKIYFVHHFEPGWEIHFRKFRFFKRNLRKVEGIINKLKAFVHLLLYPIERWRFVCSIHQTYKSAYENADIVVLLSSGFISKFRLFGHIIDDQKFRVIPNMLSFKNSISFDKLVNKENRVLIVARLDEEQKRISLALKIWRLLKQDNRSNGWCLDIVGAGPDEKAYRKVVLKNKIPNVYFYGQQNPISFYERASIFMMTSISEGWGLTLTEGMQNGVVPIAFDTYASLHDIITDGKTGFIIKDTDIHSYIDKMLYIMCNKNFRMDVAKAAINSVDKFTAAKVGAMWNDLITTD